MDTANTLQKSDWIYFKLCVGEAIDKLDHLILDIAPTAMTERTAESWFFLRYIDEDGAHIRLRIRPRLGQTEPLATQIRTQATHTLARLAQSPPPFYRPMVLPPNPPTATGIPQHFVRVVSASYEPELDKFGGEAGVAIAEGVFHASSNVAYEVLRGELEGRTSRKTLAPALMAAVLDHFPPAASPSEFWSRYALFWLGGESGQTVAWRDRFREKARELSQAGIPIYPRIRASPMRRFWTSGAASWSALPRPIASCPRMPAPRMMFLRFTSSIS